MTGSDDGRVWDDDFWSLNLPLQMWPGKDGFRVLNYMPRKERCSNLGEPVSASDLPAFCERTAKVLDNLAVLFRALGRGEIGYIYYPDQPIDEARREHAGADR